MSRIEKMLDKMRNNPKDWRIEDLHKIAERYEIVWTRPSGGSSHETFRTKDGGMLTVPAKRPIKPIYIKKFLELIDEYAGHTAD
jgi:hypothetical protein